MSSVDCIYFFDLQANETLVRIGFDGSSRIEEHQRMGQRFLCALRGSKDFEKRIHNHFTSAGALSKKVKRQTSIYEGDGVWNYVEWLVGRGLATDDPSVIEHIAAPPWESIDPKMVSDIWTEPSGQTSLVPPKRSERLKIAAAAAYHRSMSDEWFTPIEIIDSARAVLGEIDLDPASCAAANTRVGARCFYSQQVDGLLPTNEWRGRIWMNPPYGSLAPDFAVKLLSEFRVGRISAAVALFNANAMSSQWFIPMYSAARSMIITRGRLSFVPGTEGQAVSSPSTGSVILYLGPTPELFAKHFRKHGSVLIPEAAIR
jgi:ParB family chromosome partitioning protein